MDPENPHRRGTEFVLRLDFSRLTRQRIRLLNADLPISSAGQGLLEDFSG